MPTTHTIACLQTAPVFGELEANCEVVERAIADLEADLLVLPELFATGYSFRDRDEITTYAEPFPDGPTVQRLRAWSRRTGGIVVGGYPERDGDRVFNAAAIVAAGEVLGNYRKVHLFGFEREGFDPGDRPFAVHRHENLVVGTMICFDWIYPESARALAIAGADVIAHPSNLVLPGWCQQAMRIRALENHVYTVTANRFGEEHRPPRPALRFTGASRIAGPQGDVRADAEAEGQALLRVDIDVERARCKQVPSGNDLLAERRPELYADRAR
jgi:predicted amidohydrolase